MPHTPHASKILKKLCNQNKQPLVYRYSNESDLKDVLCFIVGSNNW